ncbi:class I SAM-dependent methyltransferase [Zooshikella sp. RANM57]|uniref:class I SAM-dependent methyltransferase n=1 Tax=Zooshikella sp. RANM57 TaxID=3425863 RepID=UPI003D6E8CE1
MISFSDVATVYQRLGVNQHSAGAQLIDIYDWRGSESVIDLGCGSGQLTALLAEKTTNLVMGIDCSAKMINVASAHYPHIHFSCADIEQLRPDTFNKYDVAFMNSVMHWFQKPQETLKKIKYLLNPNGLLLVQTPLKSWCPQLETIIQQVFNCKEFIPFAEAYNNPWFHLTSDQAYQHFFQKIGFKVTKSQVVTTTTHVSGNEQIWDAFMSGPAQAFFAQNNYSCQLPKDYEDHFKKQFSRITEQNQIDQLNYNRLMMSLFL